MKVAKSFVIVGVFALCFLIGIFAVPLARLAYASISPRPDYSIGNFAPLYSESGQKVVLFSTSTCPYCKQARALLDGAGVAYADYKIDQSEALNKKFLDLGGVGVPLIFIGNRSIKGYRESAIRDALSAFTSSAESRRNVAAQ